MTTELYALDYHDTRSGGAIAPPMRQDERQRVTETEYWKKYYNAPDVNYECHLSFWRKKQCLS